MNRRYKVTVELEVVADAEGIDDLTKAIDTTVDMWERKVSGRAFWTAKFTADAT